MLETMYVRCTHCGYDNSPEYRFCGMCGASLAHPPVQTQAPEKKEVAPAGNGNGHGDTVHGPSFLGLAEDPKTEFHYLYEDDQPKSHIGLVFFLLLMFGAAGALGWQWKNHGFPFNQQTTPNAAQQPASPSDAASPGQNTAANPQAPATPPANENGGVLPTEPDQKVQAGASPKEADIPPQGGDKNVAANTNAAPSNENKTADENPPAEEKPAAKTEEAKATPPPSTREKEPIKNASRNTRSAKPAPAPAAAPPAAPDADLELAGERYLYGTGVPRNCTRAEASLRTAATHGNTKAQTVLGTMYATGHCVGRDLPTAYRWFARALHQDPQNSRISADLQVLWRQMTPQEKQLATSSGQ
jgi:hypothetical protein